MKFIEIIKPGININFMGKRKLFMTISLILVLASIVPLLMAGGVHFGIDFAGGMLVQVKFKQQVHVDQVREALAPLALGSSTIQNFGGDQDSEYLIRAQNPEIALENAGTAVKETLEKVFPDQVEIRRVETVGPKVGEDLRNMALMAIFFSLLLMAVYISGRFEAKWILSAIMALLLGGLAFMLSPFMGMEGLIIMAILVTFAACWFLRLRYAMGAVVALCHDVIITVGIYTLLGKEFNLTTVAALLTIIGFSINDTIIIYDRIRENLRKSGRKSLEAVINQSVNQTLSRTILTSGTVIMVLIFLYGFGGGIIEDFALTLLLGVIIGTFSSIYIASPLVLIMPQSNTALSRLAVGSSSAARRPSRPVYQEGAGEGPMARTPRKAADDAKAEDSEEEQPSSDKRKGKVRRKKANRARGGR